MSNSKFKYKVNLVPLSINNQEQDTFRDKLNAIPYLLYEVEQIQTGEKIVINKPGGKRNFGRLSRNDFMVFIYTPSEENLWLISHKEILDDLILKFETDQNSTLQLIKTMYQVCQGADPNTIMTTVDYSFSKGLSTEIILKTYKWIWGQEDCNYPRKKGRWLSMSAILEHFHLNTDDL